MEKQPLLSVVIATFNTAAVLADCLDSLAAQTFRDFEVLIQDGSSGDGTLEIARSYATRLPHLSLHSEPDKGIYDAWNKALARLRGQWVLFLGSDDALSAPDVLKRCADVLATLPDQIHFACGGVLDLYPDGSTAQRQNCMAEGAHERLKHQFPVAHTALWHKVSLFQKDRFDASLRIAGDYDFICRTWTHEGVGQTLRFTVTHMRVGGVSSSPRHSLRTQWEMLRISMRYGHGLLSWHRVIHLAKAMFIWAVSLSCGRHAPAVLDKLRRVRGLPPCWTTSNAPSSRDDM